MNLENWNNIYKKLCSLKVNKMLILMRNIVFTIILFLCAATLAIGQNEFKKNDIYLEAGGNGLYGSINYERQLTKKAGPGFRIGLGIYWQYPNFLNLPLGFTYLFELKNKKSFIDAGLGITFTGIDENSFKGVSLVNVVPGIGYRRHTSKNLMWRMSLTPVFNKNGSSFWLGASIGKRF